MIPAKVYEVLYLQSFSLLERGQITKKVTVT